MHAEAKTNLFSIPSSIGVVASSLPASTSELDEEDVVVVVELDEVVD
jgi:hypothetical protein